MRYLAAGFWVVAGTMHFVIPRQYEAIVPASLHKYHKELVVASGIAEIAGGLMILPEGTRRRPLVVARHARRRLPGKRRDGRALRPLSEDSAGRALGAAAAAVP